MSAATVPQSPLPQGSASRGSVPPRSASPSRIDEGGSRGRSRSARQENGHRRVNWWLTALVAVLSLTVLTPLYIAIVTALKTPAELGGNALALPAHPQWGNFAEAWQTARVPHALLQTAIITVGSVVFTVLANSLVSYAIARNMDRKPFFKFLYYFFVSAIFIPFPIIMLPVVQQTAMLGLDNQAGLIILYTVYGLSMNVFLYTAFIRSIPVELEEAAAMDGAGPWTIFWRIIFPLLGPMNATVGILTCVWAWNDFLLPLVVLSDPAVQTLSLAQYVFQGQFGTNYTLAFASYLMAMAPLLLAYLFSQRWVIAGVTRGSVK